MDILKIKEEANEYVDSIKDELIEISRYIHKNPEPPFLEYKAKDRLVKFLKEHDFENIKEGISDMETSFIAEVCPTGVKEPVITICGEYDALPGGHACGHNLIAVSSIGSGYAVKKIMEKYNIHGTLRILGCPAEEDGGGKKIHIKHGVFEDVDIALLMHPTSAVSRIAGKCKSEYEFDITFRGQIAHAESHPEDGVNALDAATLFFNAIGLVRQQLPSEVGISYYLPEGGISESLIPDKTKVKCLVTSFGMKSLERAIAKVRNCIEGAAIAAGCTSEVTEEEGYAGRIENHVLCKVAKENMQILGEPVMEGMPTDNGATDFGDVERIVPGVNPYLTLLPEKKISNHTDQFRDLAVSERSEYIAELASKLLADIALDCYLDHKIIDKAWEELREVQKSSDF